MRVSRLLLLFILSGCSGPSHTADSTTGTPTSVESSERALTPKGDSPRTLSVAIGDQAITPKALYLSSRGPANDQFILCLEDDHFSQSGEPWTLRIDNQAVV